MKEKILYVFWLCFYILCVGLGTVVQRSTGLHIAFTLLSLIFFLPGILLLWEGIRTDDSKILFRVRIVSLTSLVLTVSLIVLNILTVTAGDAVGQIMHDLLILVSAPMFCCYWRGLSIFLWACLFVSSFPKIWKK